MECQTKRITGWKMMNPEKRFQNPRSSPKTMAAKDSAGVSAMVIMP